MLSFFFACLFVLVTIAECFPFVCAGKKTCLNMLANKRRCCAERPSLDTLPEDLLCHVMSFCEEKMNRLMSLHLVSRSVRRFMRSEAMLSVMGFDLRHPMNVLQLGTLAADLQRLRFKSCASLNTFQFTPKLRTLDLSYCTLLKDEQFNSVRSLTMLQTLNVSGSQLTNLDVLAHVKPLRHLCASNCNHLTRLSNMPELLTLNVDGCSKLVHLHSISGMTKLTRLNLSGSASAPDVLRTLPDSLVHLSLRYCKTLTDAHLQPFERLVNLTSLDLSGCNQIKSLAGVASLTRLEELQASYCDVLRDVKGLSSLTSLRKFIAPQSPLCGPDGELQLSGLVALEELDVATTELYRLSFPDVLPNLHTLRVHSCPLLQHVVDIGNAPRLQAVNFANNPHLDDSCLEGFSKLLDLQDACFRMCERITPLGLLKLPTTLNRLVLQGCVQLNNLTMSIFHRFSKLQRLDLQDCFLISDEGLHDLSAVRTLQHLNLSHCVKITDTGMFALSKLVHLRALRLDGCRKITDLGLRALEPLTELESLDFNRCKRLVHLRPLAALRSLKFINLSGCVALTDESLMNLHPCKNLTTIYTNHCKHVSKTCADSVLFAIQRQTQ